MSQFRELKHELSVSRDGERERLTTLTLQSDTAMRELDRKKDKVHTHTHTTHCNPFPLVLTG